MPNLPTPCYSGKGAAAVSKAVALRNEQPGRHRQSHETLNHEPPEPAPHHGHRTRRTKQNLAFARHLQNLINTEPKKYHECSAVKEASKPRASRRTSSPLATSTRHPATGRWPEFPCIRKNPNFYYPSWLQSPPCFVSSHACRSTPKPFLRKVGCSLNHENQSYGLRLHVTWIYVALQLSFGKVGLGCVPPRPPDYDHANIDHEVSFQ